MTRNEMVGNMAHTLGLEHPQVVQFATWCAQWARTTHNDNDLKRYYEWCMAR